MPPRHATALLSAVGVFSLSAPSVVSLPSQAVDPPDPVIVLDVDHPSTVVSTHLGGTNHNWAPDGHGLWLPRLDRPRATVVQRARQLRLDSSRYPGGTPAEMWDWKRSIGAQRGCQYDARFTRFGEFFEFPGSTSFGPDEYMEWVEASGTVPTIMVPIYTGTADDAADWVEYMNGRAGARGNPHGGVDWADVRARNGHRAPYGIDRWEIGNEPNIAPARYMLPVRPGPNERAYNDGGERVIRFEGLGKRCDHPREGVRSNGRRRQQFRTLWNPVVPSSFRLRVNGLAWRRVARLRPYGPKARVYTLNADAGYVRFGDNVHGRIPPRGASVRASYINPYDGFFEYQRKMREVDPSIQTCSTYNTVAWIEHANAARRAYHCLAVHSIRNFEATHQDDWGAKSDGYHLLMDSTADSAAFLRARRAALPGRVAMAVSELVAFKHDTETWPRFRGSMAYGTYVASMFGQLMRNRVAWATPDDLMGFNDGTLIGTGEPYRLSSTGLLRVMLRPMLTTPSRLVPTRVLNNPRETGQFTDGSPAAEYAALDVTTTRTSRGTVYAMIVNRSIERGHDVVMQLPTSGGGHWTVARRAEEADEFWSATTASTPDAITLTPWQTITVSATRPVHVAPHSITLLRITSAS